MSKEELIDLKDQARLELTLSTRETIIKTLMSKGIPESTSDRVTLMQALDGLDRTVLSKTKIKADDKAAQNQQHTTRLIADILSRVEIKNTPNSRTEAPALGNEVQIIDLVEGEMHDGVQTFKYDDFIK